VQDLPLEVDPLDGIGIDHPERADTGSGQVEERPVTETAGSDDATFAARRRRLPSKPSSGIGRDARTSHGRRRNAPVQAR
jgi:hypothetical protein